jgi:nicotinamidase/pyrazinamidase
MTALILVDIQNDFLPGGALAVKEGDQIIPIVRQLLEKHFDTIVATKDWHPPNHGSFAVTHGKRPGEHTILDGIDQILWPVHCVQGTPGADFGPGWDTSKVQKVFYKGTEQNVDSYSTFFDNEHRKSTGLEKYLRDRAITDIYLAGLTTDYCVKYSVLDARTLGFNTYVIQDGCRAVNLEEGDEKHALDSMRTAGAQILNSKQLKRE